MARRDISIQWPAHFEYRQVAQPKSVLVLLHGYQQNGADIMAALGSMAEANQAVVAPDGLFPVPRSKSGQPLKLGFSWYVFDPNSNRYLIEMDTACDYVKRLLAELDLLQLPARVIGFSMGAYLAPHVGLHLPNCRHVIGINGRFRSEVLTTKLPFRIDGIAGADDVLVDPDRAASCHEELVERGCVGTFTRVAGSGHRINEAISQACATQVQLTALGS